MFEFQLGVFMFAQLVFSIFSHSFFVIPSTAILNANLLYTISQIFWFALSAGTVKYTDCTSHDCPGYDTKLSDGEVPLMLGSWERRSTPSLALLLGPFWRGSI